LISENYDTVVGNQERILPFLSGASEVHQYQGRETLIFGIVSLQDKLISNRVVGFFVTLYKFKTMPKFQITASLLMD